MGNFNRRSGCFLIGLFPILLFVVMMNHTIAFGNQTKIDSLRQVLLQTTNDSIAIKVCLKLGVRWESMNFDSAMYYYNKALRLSVRNGWLNKKAKVLGNIGVAYANGPGSETALDYLQKSLNIYQETGNQKGELDCYYKLGSLNTYFEKFPQAIELLNKAVKLGIALNDESRLADIYNNLGLTYYYSGQFDKASIYQFKSLQIGEKSGDKKVRYTHINIGLTYSEQENFEKSLEHYNKALNLFLETNEKPHIALIYKSIGDIYMAMNEFDYAINYYNKAYIIYKELNDLVSISRYYMMMGIIYHKQGLLNKAFLTYQQALDTLPAKGSKSLLFAIYSNTADVNLDLADLSKNNKTKLLNQTIVNGKKMIQIAHDLGSISKETESYEILYKAYTKIGNTKVALEYAEKFISSKDSLFSIQKEKTIADIQTKYETEKKELEIDLLNSENNLISNKLSQSNELRKNQRAFIYLLIGGFITVCIFIIIIYRFYLQKRKANNILITQNTIISKQKEEKEVLLKEIHHRVKNNLQIISSLLNLQTKNIKDKSTLSAMADGQNRVMAMALIHQKLYQNANISSIIFKDYTSQLLNQIAGLYPELKDVKREVVSEDIELDIDTAVPVGLILSELITNTYKYAFVNGKGSIVITLKQTGSNYILEVQDNGPGLPKDFDLSTASSIGLRLVRRLSRQLYGTSTYKYKNGSRFIITFKDTLSRKETA